MKQFYINVIALIAIPFMSYAQNGSKMIGHEIYDNYKTNRSAQLSNDGNWFTWTVAAEKGNPITYVQHTKLGARHILELAESPKFLFSSDYLVFKKTADFEELRSAKLDGKKGDKLPQDSLAILNLNNGEVKVVTTYKKFSYPKESDMNIVAWVADHVKGEADTTEADKKRKGNDLFIHHLDQDSTVTLNWVTDEMEFSNDGSTLLCFHAEVDSTQEAGAVIYSPSSMQFKLIHSGNKYYNSPAVSESGKYATYRTTTDTLEEDKVKYELHISENGNEASKKFVDDELTASKGARFSKDETLLMWSFETMTSTYKDDSLLKSEWPELNIWKWDAPYIPTLQENRFKSDANKQYRLTNLNSEKTADVPYFEYTSPSTVYDLNANMVLLQNYAPYGAENMADYPGKSDLHLFYGDSRNFKDVLQNKKISYTTFSPEGSFIVWFDMIKQEWYSHNTKSGNTQEVSTRIPHQLSDEEHDTPSDPYPYGFAGFLDDDKTLLVYDRYDVWAVDLRNPNRTYCLTNGEGRKNSVVYRIQDVDRTEMALNTNNLYYTAFNEESKSESFGRINSLSKNFNHSELITCDCNLGRVIKAQDENTFAFTKSDFKTFPDYFVVKDNNWKEVRRLTETAKQLEQYHWGTVESTEWEFEGQAFDGLIYKPKDFDSTKQYPMIVYFYEKYADRIHQFWHPTPSRSIINPTIYTSQGYVIFIPDIYYATGQPGQDAYSAIMSGTDHMLDMGYIDESRMGLQGQSWGGYQTAYMVTQTERYAAAMAGAPVSNMTSAYGGIRWGSGLNRSFQYEHTQSRLGTTMWEDLDTYINNSPLFFVDQIETPLLIMHNDKDGAVPWYQGIEMFIAMRRLQKEAWLLQYKGDDHNLLKWDNRKDLSRRMLDFFDYYLKPEERSTIPEWMETGRPVRYENSELRY